jgi:hypothetical protein
MAGRFRVERRGTCVRSTENTQRFHVISIAESLK